MVTYRIFDEIVDFITSAPLQEQILSYKPSLKAQNRLEELLERKREQELSEGDKHELEQYLLIEHLMRLAKARARQRLAA